MFGQQLQKSERKGIVKFLQFKIIEFLYTSPSTRSPVLISGPLVSRATASTTPNSLAAVLALAATDPWYCEKFSN